MVNPDLPYQQSKPPVVSQAEATWPLVRRDIDPVLLPLPPGHIALGHIALWGDKVPRPYNPDL